MRKQNALIWILVLAVAATGALAWYLFTAPAMTPPLTAPPAAGDDPVGDTPPASADDGVQAEPSTPPDSAVAPAPPPPEDYTMPGGSLHLTPAGEQAGAFITLTRSPVRVELVPAGGPVTRVQFFLVPTGTETWELRQLLHDDTDPSDGWAFDWEFSGAVLGHLVAVAETPRGEFKAETGVYHDPGTP